MGGNQVELNWSTIITGAFTAVVNAVAVFFATRYMAKMVERVERKREKKDE